jgi:hypothetical protein
MSGYMTFVPRRFSDSIALSVFLILRTIPYKNWILDSKGVQVDYLI